MAASIVRTGGTSAPHSKTVGVGVIGVGFMGRTHIRAYQAAAGAVHIGKCPIESGGGDKVGAVLHDIRESAALLGCFHIANKIPSAQSAVIVTVFADSGTKYLSERFWDEH